MATNELNEVAWKGGFKRLIGDADNPTFGIAVHNASQAVHIFDPVDAEKDWNVSAYTDPTLLIHCSDTNAATDYIKIWHDDTDANIQAYGATQLTVGLAGTEYLTLTTTTLTLAAGVGLAMSTTGKLVIPVKASGSTTSGDVWLDTTDYMVHYYANGNEYTVTAT